jgi:isoleucyl-tRNA synthetase
MTKKNYPSVLANPDFPSIEQSVIAKWQQNDTFHNSINGEQEYVFYDGPPFANGLPHYGHLLTGYIKDAFPRYQTMLGNKVNRRFGWDCHGLPAEMEAEKSLGVSGRTAIEAYGIDKFNAYCKQSVLRYTNEWREYVNRQARWVDFENDYKTMDISFMESVIWAFKSLYDKGLLYESMRVLPYSWACQTPVSDFETRMDNSYREKASKAVTLAFTLTAESLNNLNQKLGTNYSKITIRAWTTTPWTLPSNLALAVGGDLEYCLCTQAENEAYIIAAAFKPEDITGLPTFLGSELVSLSYEPVFPYFLGHKNAFKIIAGDFVTTEDGTGVVHIAPGFGEDDHRICLQHDIELVCPVDEGGKFTYPVTDYIGMQVFETNDDIIKYLKQTGAWINTSQYLHNYPHCWRTDTPLIYKAVPSWYLKVTAIKDKMLANNQKINWIPGHVKNGLFGKWLEGARDWSISRNRFWGCPIPVWQSDDPQYPNIEVYGSLSEIESAFGAKVEDLHRPFIDSLVRPNPKDPTGKSMMRRVPDVLDCWFESGSMPFAQVHYPFENKEWFENHFPADFIVEYVGQTRGWFYTMVVLATAIFDQPPFLNCICHGVILGDGGKKLSKRLKNYVDPNDVFAEIGSDALRWCMLSSPVMVPFA